VDPHFNNGKVDLPQLVIHKGLVSSQKIGEKWSFLQALEAAKVAGGLTVDFGPRDLTCGKNEQPAGVFNQKQ
jgi:hypothetical protein